MILAFARRIASAVRHRHAAVPMHAIDHLFVFCDREAPEQRALDACGLAIGGRREHPGQGTANVCYGFADGCLELLWVNDDAGARDPMVKPLGLAERAHWRKTGASPFGICVRPLAAGTPPPFVSWDYRPAWLPKESSIAMGCNSGVIFEPLLFAVDRPFTPLDVPHRLSASSLVRAVVTVRDMAPMSLLREVVVPGLEIRSGDEPLLELSFAPSRGEVVDLRPTLPLVLRC
jgi:hypothetical protein